MKGGQTQEQDILGEWTRAWVTLSLWNCFEQGDGLDNLQKFFPNYYSINV